MVHEARVDWLSCWNSLEFCIKMENRFTYSLKSVVSIFAILKPMKLTMGFLTYSRFVVFWYYNSIPKNISAMFKSALAP